MQFPASDGVIVTADFNTPSAAATTVIVLYHMAGASRGEYLQTAERLNTLGYATLALDQHSGGQFNGMKNETVVTAGAQKVGVLGSSYSAGLVLVLSAKDRCFADAVMSFSPAEYYGAGTYVAHVVGNITVPVFLNAARSETGQWKPLQAQIKTPVVGFVPNGSGRHGTSALDCADGAEYWEALETFLAQHLSP